MSKGEETRQAILDEALGLASTVGLSGLSIGSLAKATGMSKSGLFAHFRSKEQLELHVLEEARRRFVDLVIAPALKQPRGVPRIREMFARTLDDWEQSLPGGCFFYAIQADLDDQPGAVRDAFVLMRKDLAGTIRRAAEITVEEGHFRKDLSLDQFVFDYMSIIAAYHHFDRLMNDPDASARAKSAFDALVARSK